MGHNMYLSSEDTPLAEDTNKPDLTASAADSEYLRRKGSVLCSGTGKAKHELQLEIKIR